MLNGIVPPTQKIMTQAKTKTKEPETSTCWWCKQLGATIRTAPQPPDNEEWWFHEECYWELQAVMDD
jgi:hypothetical protein